VLDRDRTSQDDFLGCCEIPIDGELLSGAVVDRWYALQNKAHSTGSGSSTTISYNAQPTSAVHSTAATAAAPYTASSTPTAAVHKSVSVPAGLHTRSATIATAGGHQYHQQQQQQHSEHSSSASQPAHLPPRRTLSAPWRGLRGSLTPVRRASDPAETAATASSIHSESYSPASDRSAGASAATAAAAAQQHTPAHRPSLSSVLHRKLSLPTRRSSSSASTTTATHSPGSAVSSVSDLGYAAAAADASSRSLDSSATAGANATGGQYASSAMPAAAAAPLSVQLPPSGTALGHVRIRLWYQFNETSHLVR
jgi:hypothetical protein